MLLGVIECQAEFLDSGNQGRDGDSGLGDTDHYATLGYPIPANVQTVASYVLTLF